MRSLQKALGLRLGQLFLIFSRFFVVLMIHVDERRFGLHRVRRDEAAFDKLVWRMFLKQIPVFKRPRSMFACIANKRVFLHPMIQNLLPLDTGGTTCAPSPRPRSPAFFSSLTISFALSSLMHFFQVGSPGSSDRPRYPRERHQACGSTRGSVGGVIHSPLPVWLSKYRNTIRRPAGIRQGNVPDNRP